MKHRVQRSRTQPVPVTLQLFDHAQAKDRFFARMVQDVDTDQAGQQFLIPDVLDFCYPHI